MPKVEQYIRTCRKGKFKMFPVFQVKKDSKTIGEAEEC